jgi:hypothetical protein
MVLHRNCRKYSFHNTIYVITRFPGNPVNGRGGDIDVVDMTCEIAQVVYIAVTAVILAKERSIKVVDREALK